MYASGGFSQHPGGGATAAGTQYAQTSFSGMGTSGSGVNASGASMSNGWSARPPEPVLQAMIGVNFIANHLRSQDEDNKVGPK